MVDGRTVGAAFVLGSLGATDWVDGWLARRLDQTSELGAILDPTADRLVFLVGVGTILFQGGVPVWFCIAVLAREAFVAAMMVGATLAGMERFPVTRAGKTATFALLWAVPWILAGSAGGVWTVFGVIGWCLGVPGLALSWVTAVRYVPVVRQHLRRGEYRGGRESS
jgi:cardiolipin synthase